MEDLFLVLHYIFFAYASVIGFMINMFCESKALYYLWEETDFAKTKKWSKRQTIQLKVQISAFIMMIVCWIMNIIL